MYYSPFGNANLQEIFFSCINKNGFESRKIKKLIAKIALKMKIDKKNYSAFKENDSLNDKRLQELFLMEPMGFEPTTSALRTQRSPS